MKTNYLVKLLSITVLFVGCSPLCAMQYSNWKIVTPEHIAEQVQRSKDNRPYKFSCSMCENGFQLRNSLNLHLSSQHNACFDCLRLDGNLKTFQSVRDLVTHYIKNESTHQRNYCRHCLNYIQVNRQLFMNHEFNCEYNPNRIAEQKANTSKSSDDRSHQRRCVNFRKKDINQKNFNTASAAEKFTDSSVVCTDPESVTSGGSRFGEKLQINPSYYPVQINSDHTTQLCDVAPIMTHNIFQMYADHATELCGVTITPQISSPAAIDFEVGYVCNICQASFISESEAQVHVYNRECCFN